MFYAFNLVDTKRIDKFTMDSIDAVNIVGFRSKEELENFTERNYTYICIYNCEDKYPEPIDFTTKIEAKKALIKCLTK